MRKAQAELVARAVASARGPMLAEAGFKRSGQSAQFTRRVGAMRQQIKLLTRIGRAASAYLEPYVYVYDADVAKAAGLLVQNDPSLFQPSDIILAQSIGQSSPKHSLLDWEITDAADADRISQELGRVLVDSTLPFLNELSTPRVFWRLYMSDDKRVARDGRQALLSAAAAWITDGAEAARSVLDRWLSPGMAHSRRRYQRAFDVLTEMPSPVQRER